MSPRDSSDLIKRIGAQLGFCRVGIAAAAPLGRPDYLQRWLEAGRAGTMEYLKRNNTIRTDPGRLFPGARSVIVAAMNYHVPSPDRPSDGPRGRIARYAWGKDYHRVVRERLVELVAKLRARIPEPFLARVCVDTAPLLERELAAAAGIGWIGKNTLVLHQEMGSYFFLGEVVTTLDLAVDEPVTDHCGNCRRCLDACPTRAFPAPYEMDASRCISYLTIEHRGPIAAEFHAAMGDWVYGCDICQEVCPYNRDASATDEPDLQIQFPAPFPSLPELATWTPQDYGRLSDSAMNRAQLSMLQRNARIALNNTESESSP